MSPAVVDLIIMTVLPIAGGVGLILLLGLVFRIAGVLLGIAWDWSTEASATVLEYAVGIIIAAVIAPFAGAGRCAGWLSHRIGLGYTKSKARHRHKKAERDKARAAERELWELYEQHAADEMSFEDFRAFMESDDEEPAIESNSNGPVDAAELLGLPKDGSFDRAELMKAYKSILKSIHPDVAGPQCEALARVVNEAVMTIKRERGWT